MQKDVIILSDLKVRVNMLKQLNIPYTLEIMGSVIDNKINKKKYCIYKLEYANKVYLEQIHRTNKGANDYILVYDFEKETIPKIWYLEVLDSYLNYPVDYYIKKITLG